jgi:hypothetical protein
MIWKIRLESRKPAFVDGPRSYGRQTASGQTIPALLATVQECLNVERLLRYVKVTMCLYVHERSETTAREAIQTKTG